MRRFGLLGFLALLLLVGAVGVVSYNLGLAAGAADAAVANGATVVYSTAQGASPFALILGAFFVVLIIGFVARAFAGPRMPMGPGAWGWRHGWASQGWGAHGGWDHASVPEPFRPMLERWHQDVHREHHGGGPQPGDRHPHERQPAAPPSAVPGAPPEAGPWGSAAPGTGPSSDR